jgi:5-formyltetrahydrofolate cyclo-ligase
MSDVKRALRARMRAERDRFAMTCDSMIAPPPAYLARLKPGMVVASYVALGSEADPARLAAAARTAGATLALPHIYGFKGALRFLVWRDEDPLITGPFGLRQPEETAAEVVPDIILTPLVAFDDSLNRLGQGAGHYDRAFARHPDAWRVGVAWSVQRLLAIATDPWDVPLHAVITETGILP